MEEANKQTPLIIREEGAEEKEKVVRFSHSSDSVLGKLK